ncbi:bifunctional folylpolyglutamate synthase/dihydrofolate synthase [Deinococcus roseus]|uniref:tetrahydrofolate synthase n=1 Tax=Deinococcus roseus TaxID=392414 RepID=A0ABQ2DK43_9DEIO|nr:folylpolyglutamate synthase/dihydrofolate synthase family protein [Deinococcus roseus]GGJ59883.1 bifunctional folylpolyglutamate synthase/dihydrofolate synthase [Deinococcus roseus]
MNLLDWLFSRQSSIKPGLERIQHLLQRLEHPEHAFRTLLIGGTNGKGSTSATLEAILRFNGVKTGLFTSPHLTRFTERFKVAGHELPETEVIEALKNLKPLAEETGASFFEIITALACVLFKKHGVEVALMEVGMGGRFDSTNALDPVLSIISSIGLDHTQFLGDTLSQIAFEKAGIMRPQLPTLTGAVGEGLQTLQSQAVLQGAHLHVLGEDLEFQGQENAWDGIHTEVKTPWGKAQTSSNLIGSYQIRNTALAASAALALGHKVPEKLQVQWPGRMELLHWQGKELLLDGAHNPEGARALVQALRALGVEKVPVVFGSAADKDIAAVAAELDSIASEVILTRAVLSPRAADPETLKTYFSARVQVAPTPEEALSLLPSGLSLVAGSLYLLGEIRPLVLGEKLEDRERWQ